jgi:hypothetical protein
MKILVKLESESVNGVRRVTTANGFGRVEIMEEGIMIKL